MYRSKDNEYMSELKKAIFESVPEVNETDKEFAWKYMAKYIKLDDLRAYAIQQLPNETIVLGKGSCNAQVVIITHTALTDDENVLLAEVLQQAGVSIGDTYITTYVKVDSSAPKKEYFSQFNVILSAEMNIVQPKVMIIFGDDCAPSNVSVPVEVTVRTTPLEECLNCSSELQIERKAELTKAIQEATKALQK